LLRSRSLENYRLGIYYLIAIDETELYRFKEKHYENCLYETRSDKKQYYSISHKRISYLTYVIIF